MSPCIVHSSFDEPLLLAVTVNHPKSSFHRKFNLSTDKGCEEGTVELTDRASQVIPLSVLKMTTRETSVPLHQKRKREMNCPAPRTD